MVYDDVGLNVLGYVADIVGTNCNKLLKLTINQEVCVCVGGGGGGRRGGGGSGDRFGFSTCKKKKSEAE